MMSTNNQEKKEITKEQAEEIFGDSGESYYPTPPRRWGQEVN